MHPGSSIDDLPPAEASLLWLMRTWVVGHCRGQDVSARPGAALGDLGAADAAVDLEGFMAALGHGATRPIEVLCHCRTELSADERLLLDALALLQQGDAEPAHARLRTMLTGRAADVAIRSGENLADGLGRAGLALPWVTPSAEASHRILH